MSIDDLVFYAKRAGLDFLSVTDHDTMDGVARAAALGERHGIQVLPAAELSCIDGRRGRKVHILSYLPDKPGRLLALFGKTLAERSRAGREMAEMVMRMYPVTEEHLQRCARGSKALYKVHIMQALIDLGYDSQIYGELYRTLFGREGICRAPLEYADVRDALDVVRGAGAVAVLAHPYVYDSLDVLEELAGQGLIHGVEVNHPSAPGEKARELHRIADHYGLVKTGGTDFHGSYSSRPNPLASCIATEEWIGALYACKKEIQRTV